VSVENKLVSTATAVMLDVVPSESGLPLSGFVQIEVTVTVVLPDSTLCALESDEVLETKMKQKWLQDLHLKHEARFQTLQAVCELKEKA
jgi:hypothetical protein